MTHATNLTTRIGHLFAVLLGGVCWVTDRKLDFQGDRIREGFMGRVTGRN